MRLTFALVLALSASVVACTAASTGEATSSSDNALTGPNVARAFNCSSTGDAGDATIRVVVDSTRPNVTSQGFGFVVDGANVIRFTSILFHNTLTGALDNPNLATPPIVISLNEASGAATYANKSLTCVADHITPSRTFECEKNQGESGPDTMRVSFDLTSSRGLVTASDMAGEQPLIVKAVTGMLVMSLDTANGASSPTILTLDPGSPRPFVGPTTTTATPPTPPTPPTPVDPNADTGTYAFAGCDPSLGDCDDRPITAGVAKISCREVM